MPPEEIGGELRLRRERVHQIEAQALAKERGSAYTHELATVLDYKTVRSRGTNKAFIVLYRRLDSDEALDRQMI